MTEKLKFSPRHEQIIIGSMIRHKSIRKELCKELISSNFFVNRHKVIFNALRSIEEQNLEYTPSTIESLITDNDWGGKKYLDELELKGQDENIKHHVNEMKCDVSKVYCFEKLLPEFVTDLKDPRTDFNSLVTQSKSIYENLKDSGSTNYYSYGKEAAGQYIASLKVREIKSSFRTSGYLALDKKLSEGFADGKLSVIAATPSTGKTSLMLNMARRQSKKWKVGILAWECGQRDSIDSICSSKLKIPLDNLIKFSHLIKTEEQENIDDFVFELFKTDHLAFLKPPPRSLSRGTPWDVNNRILDWVEAKLETWKRNIIYWDLFLKKLPARNPDQVSLALDRMQEMVSVERLNMHACLLHQLTLKELEKRANKQPTKGDLKGTGAWMETPDLVLGLYRPGINENNMEDNEINIIGLKQRRGEQMWKIVFDWNGPCVRITGGREEHLIIPEERKYYGKGKKGY